GNEEGRCVGGFLKGKRVDALYASPMKRVHQTLAACQLDGVPKPVILHDLREVDFGDWTGLHWTEVQDKYGISAVAWLDQLECEGIPNAESSVRLRARVEPCLSSLLQQHSGQQVAVFCHGGVIRMILSILLGWPFPRLGTLEIDYASLTQLIWAPPLARLKLVNFTPWRELVQ